MLVVAAILTAVVSQIGDLSASIIKRTFHVKDFGQLMPGTAGFSTARQRFVRLPFLYVFEYVFLYINRLCKAQSGAGPLEPQPGGATGFAAPGAPDIKAKETKPMNQSRVNIALLGSTGSIGRQALEVAEAGGMTVTAICADRNVSLMEEQCRRHRPRLAALRDERAARELRQRLADTGIKVLAGEEGVATCACEPNAGIVLNALVGIAGLKPTLAAIDAGKDIALANKETLVAGGSLVTKRAKARGVRILPVDSEHSAIFQSLLSAGDQSEVSRILLTASGGPFFGKTRKELSAVTKKDALRHPNWSMGPKITVDSATLMNKGLELIEAVWLFGVPPEKVEILIHPQSIIHSLVEFIDIRSSRSSARRTCACHTIRPHLSPAKARPGHAARPALRPADLCEPDYEAFPSPLLCREAVAQGGVAAAAVNGANEEAVALFLEGRISFLDIPQLCREALAAAKTVADPGFPISRGRLGRPLACPTFGNHRLG